MGRKPLQSANIYKERNLAGRKHTIELSHPGALTN